MPPAPLLIAWSNLAGAWLLLRQRHFATGYIGLIGATVPVGYQALWLGLRFITSALVWSATILLGATLAYFCFVESKAAAIVFLEQAGSKSILEAQKASTAVGLLMGFGGTSSFITVIFLAWKRRQDFQLAFQRTWTWICQGGMNATDGWVRALTKQMVIYVGLFFTLLVLRDNLKKIDPVPIPLDPHEAGFTRILESRLAAVRFVTVDEITNVQKQLTALQVAVRSRDGIVVYLDKSPDLTNPGQAPSDQSEFQLIYVALFENASFESDSKVGRKLSFGESKRLEKFAKSLLQIAETLRIAGNKAGRLKIDVRGFASDAPKNLSAKEKDEKNNEVANDRARSVYEVLFEALKDTVDMPPPVPWEKSGLEMHKKRQFNDGPVQRPSSEDTARAEAPNRRVEILVTLPPVLRVSRVSDDITRENVSQR